MSLGAPGAQSTTHSGGDGHKGGLAVTAARYGHDDDWMSFTLLIDYRLAKVLPRSTL